MAYTLWHTRYSEKKKESKKSGILEKGSGYKLNWKNSAKKSVKKIVEKGSGYGLNWKNSDKKIVKIVEKGSEKIVTIVEKGAG